MPVLKWKEEYSVGVRVIDEEHRLLVEMINKAFGSMENIKEEKVLAELVEEMRRYAMRHFATEEGLMILYAYPLEEEHKMEHSDFMLTAASSDGVLGNDRGVLDPVSIIKFLADWLQHHILETDMKLGRFLNDQGVS